jgi:hypothetical protein
LRHPRRYQTLAPKREIVAGAAATFPHRGSATLLGAEAGSAGAAGERRGSSRRYQTPRLTKNLTSASKIRTSRLALATVAAFTTLPRAYQTRALQLALATAAALTTPPRAYQTRASQLAPTIPRAYQNPHLANLAPTKPRAYQTRASQLPARIYQSRAYQVGPTNSCYHLAPRISRPRATKFKSRDPPLRKSKPWPAATQDPPLPKLKPS